MNAPARAVDQAQLEVNTLRGRIDTLGSQLAYANKKVLLLTEVLDRITGAVSIEEVRSILKNHGVRG
jgi:hypothetical protein